MLTQVHEGKYMMGFYENDCHSDYIRKKTTWERVAFVYDKNAQTQTIIVDGVVVKTCTGKSPFMGKGTVVLGQWLHRRLWKGKIKNVKIFNQALPVDKINVLQQRNASALLLS